MCQSKSFEQVAVAAQADGAAARAGRRERVEWVLERAEHLPAGDRFLLRQVFEFGASVGDIARQMGRLRGVIYRRIRRLLRRLRNPLFAYVVARGDLLPPPLRQAGWLVAVEGRSLENAAAAIGCSRHVVRVRIAAIRRMAREESQALAARRESNDQ